ncbi:speedy protein C isoform 3-T3 [Glossophaga mutica]
MSEAQDPAHAVATQVKPWGWNHRDGGSGAVCSRQHQELRAFLYLLEHSFLQEFLSRDPCFQISDKYLLAMVLVYFRRANLELSEYTCSNLFLALNWHSQVTDFLRQRDKLWARMGFRAVVSRQCCEEVMAKEPYHWAWTRERRPHHGGAQRSCPKAQVPLPRGPGLSPPRCSLCGVPSLYSHCCHQPRPLPVLPTCPSPNPEWYCPPSHACLSVTEDPWGGGFLMVLPPQLHLEPGTYTLHSELGTGDGGAWAWEPGKQEWGLTE